MDRSCSRPRSARWISLAAVLGAVSLMAAAPAGSPAGTARDRADSLLAKMTLDEKIALVHGNGFRFGVGYAGQVPANARLGIPDLYLTDGPNGVGNGSKGVTAFPAAVNTAATWDADLVRQYGEAVGREQAGQGNNVALTPTVNILRVPEWGRGFETFSEDPHLTAVLAAQHIKGIQSQGVIATVKHFLANNQEILRDKIDVKVSERALREIYLPAFHAAVKDADVGAVMCAYNKVGGTYACEHPWALTTLLKEEWGFQGFVVSDWWGTHSTVAAAQAGLDMEMPAGEGPFGPEYFGASLKKAVESGEVPAGLLDDKVRRILLPMFKAGLFDRKPVPRGGNVSTAEQRRFARQLSEEGMVLLKNDGSVLPLEDSSVRSIAVIGVAAGEQAKLTGGGSAQVNASRVRTPLDGIKQRARGRVVTYAAGTFGTGPLPSPPEAWLAAASGAGAGFEARYYANPDLAGEPVATRVDAAIRIGDGPPAAPGLPPMGWSASWKGRLKPPTTGVYRVCLEGGGEAILTIDGKRVLRNWSQFGGISHGLLSLEAGKVVDVRLDYRATGFPFGTRVAFGMLPPDPPLLDAAVAAAKAADVAVVFVSDVSTEGADRNDLSLPGDQDRLVAAVAKANRKTVVVLNTGGPTLMPWLRDVAGVIEAWYAGQEYGDAVAAVLFGDVNPSGRLPMTFPAAGDQGPGRTPETFPGVGEVVRYDEGLLVGYRWFDAKGQAPLFPFGHGLSYTDFRYGDLSVTPARVGADRKVTVTVPVTNVGGRDGSEVVQLYVGFPESAGEPPRQLKAFHKTRFKGGESRVVTLTLDEQALSIWDEAAKRWTVPTGTYTVAAGRSSRDLRTQGRFEVAP